MSRNTKLINELLEEIERSGWRVERGSKHFKIFPSDPSITPFQVPISPSDWRWRLNLRSKIRRAGWTGPCVLD